MRELNGTKENKEKDTIDNADGQPKWTRIPNITDYQAYLNWFQENISEDLMERTYYDPAKQ